MDTRREFLRKAAAAALGLTMDWARAMPESDRLGDILPQRQLTRNGEKVTAFCLGGYHLGLTENPGDAERMIERSMELGVRFFDNARRYNNGPEYRLPGSVADPCTQNTGGCR